MTPMVSTGTPRAPPIAAGTKKQKRATPFDRVSASAARAAPVAAAEKSRHPRTPTASITAPPRTPYRTISMPQAP